MIVFELHYPACACACMCVCVRVLLTLVLLLLLLQCLVSDTVAELKRLWATQANTTHSVRCIFRGRVLAGGWFSDGSNVLGSLFHISFSQSHPHGPILTCSI